MDKPYRSKPSAYAGSQPTEQASPGMFSGLLDYLAGREGASQYRTKDGYVASSGAPSSGYGGDASYKTAPKEAPADDSGDTESDCGCPEGMVNEVYVD